MNRQLTTLSLAATLTVVSLAGFGCERSLVALRDDGDKALIRGDYERAIADYTEYLDRRPGNPNVHAGLGRAYLAKGDTAHAREQLLLANSLRIEDDAILESLCDALVADKANTDLIRILRQRSIDRGLPSDFHRLGAYAQKIGDVDEAQRALITASRLENGMNVDTQIALSDLYAAVGNKPEALRRIRMAYALKPMDKRVGDRIAAMGEISGPSFALSPSAE
jgi:tetratricopeptide (TPR) repeat protein